MKLWVALAIITTSISSSALAQSPRRQEGMGYQKKYKDGLPPKTELQKAYTNGVSGFKISLAAPAKDHDLFVLKGSFEYQKNGNNVVCSFSDAKLEAGSWTTICEDKDYYATIYLSANSNDNFYALVHENITGADPIVTKLYRRSPTSLELK